MERLKYKTRGMVPPNREPRVYFCCHPKDFQSCFKGISDEILEAQNCSVWYDSMTQNEKDEELLSDLKQMQLFVLPVTTNLLCTKNSALDIEFKFALENRIPVLPLMQEQGLEKLFSKKCGDLQYLDKYADDPTALSYDCKLKGYLNSVLIGDELADKIRAAFDAYVFLSYRKKDRKYARELMGLIHKNEFCRDIAIWYDEFLTPGENFNDSIKDAIQKSGLFVLAVTPNILEDGNFVMKHEYPMAKNEGKAVLPAELIKTDKRELSVKFEGLPACADVYNEPELNKALQIAVKNMALRENDADPEHNFFIGLAYLSGVDVEVDHARALALIESSAKDGLIEAVSKLVEMYRTGLGVKRDYKTAIYWQEEKIKCLDAINKSVKSADSLEKLFWAIVDCGDFYKEIAMLCEARGKYDFALTYTENIGRNRAIVYNRLGNVYKADGLPAKATELYRKALEIHLAISDEDMTLQTMRDISWGCSLIGDIMADEGFYSQAKNYYQKDFDICKAIDESLGTVDSRRDLAVCLSHLGDICMEEGNIAQAKEYYKKDTEISALICEGTSEDKYLRGLSVSYFKLASAYKSENELDTAKEYYMKALAINEELYGKTNTIVAKSELASVYSELGRVYHLADDNEKAIAYLKHSEILRRDLDLFASTADTKYDLSITLNSLGDIYTSMQNFLMAEGCYRQALDLRRAVADKHGSVRAIRDVAACYIKLCEFYRLQDDSALAEYYCRKALSILESIEEETQSISAKKEIALCYELLGNALGKPEYGLKGALIRAEAARSVGAVADLRAAVLSYCKNAVQITDERSQYLKKAAELCDELSAMQPEEPHFKELADGLKGLIT